MTKPEKPQKPAHAPPCGCLPGDHRMTQKERHNELRRIRAAAKAAQRRKR